MAGGIGAVCYIVCPALRLDFLSVDTSLSTFLTEEALKCGPSGRVTGPCAICMWCQQQMDQARTCWSILSWTTPHPRRDLPRARKTGSTEPPGRNPGILKDWLSFQRAPQKVNLSANLTLVLFKGAPGARGRELAWRTKVPQHQ